MSRARHIAYGAHRCQFGELWSPCPNPSDDAVPLVVLFHGGYWRSVYTRRLMDRLATDIVQRGWAAFNVEYRRVGIGGGRGGWPQTFDDARGALDAVGELEGIDLSRVVTCGHSAGGHLALWTAGAAKRDAQARRGLVHDGIRLGAARTAVVVPVLAVSLAGVVDIVGAAQEGLGNGAVQRLMGGEPAELADHYRRVSLPAALPLGVPQLVIHGTADTVVPLRMAESYSSTARASGDTVDFVPIEGADHMSMIDPSSRAWGVAVGKIGESLS